MLYADLSICFRAGYLAGIYATGGAMATSTRRPAVGHLGLQITAAVNAVSCFYRRRRQSTTCRHPSVSRQPVSMYITPAPCAYVYYILAAAAESLLRGLNRLIIGLNWPERMRFGRDVASEVADYCRATSNVAVGGR